MENAVAVPSNPILRLVVRFCDKKFMILIPHNAKFKDVKSEVLRVYRGICPSLANRTDLSVIELRDYSGCILFDEYEVGLLVQDLTKIYAVCPGEDNSLFPNCSLPVLSRRVTPFLTQIQTNFNEDPLLCTPSSTHNNIHDSSSSISQSGHLATSSCLPLCSSLLLPQQTSTMACVTSSENVSQSFNDNKMRQPVCTLKSMTPSKAHPSPDRGVIDEAVTESSGYGSMDHPSSKMPGSQSGRNAKNSSSMSDTPVNSVAVFTSKVAISQSPNDLSEIQLRQPTCTLELKTPFRVSPQHTADNGKVQSDEPDTEPSGTMTCGSNNSSLLKTVCSQSNNSADSSLHSSSVSQQSTPTVDALFSMVAITSGCEMRQPITTLKTPPESYFQPTADESRSGELLTASCDTWTHQNITGGVFDYEMKNRVEHEHHIGRFKAKDKTRQVPKELKSRKSSDQPVYFKREGSGSARRFSNSEEESCDSPNVAPKAKHRCRYLLPKKEKNVTENQSDTAGYQQNTSKIGFGEKKAKVKQQSVSVLKAKAQVHYPGYSSGWSSSSDSETKKDIMVTTQGSEERENQLSNSSSMKSTISTSSWTSSEEDDKEQQLQKKYSSKSKLSDIESVIRGRSVYLPRSEHKQMFNKECYEENDNRKTAEHTQDLIPLAPDSVDMEMEPQAHEDSQRQGGSPTDVIVIPETQEVRSDVDGVSNSKVVAEQLGSPIIPMQNYLQITNQGSASNESLPCCRENQAVHSSSIKSKTSAIPHLGLSLSDMDSHLVLVSTASNNSISQNRKQKQKKLLEKIKKRHPRRGFSDMGDSASNAECRGIDSCLGRKVRLSAKAFRTYCRKKQFSRQKRPSIQGDEENANNLDSSVAKCISDSEFVCPSLRRLMSLSRGSTTIQKSVSLSEVERSSKRSEEAPVSTDKQLSEVSEGEPSGRVISKQKSRKVDHALSPKSASEPTQSQSPNSSELNLKRHIVTKKANLRKRKRTAKEVIKISSDSESGDFEPPLFKKRKPHPNSLQPRKQKPILLDKIYNSAKVHNACLKLSTEEKLRSGSEPILEKSSDSEQRPLTVKGHYQGTTSTDEEEATTQSITSTGCSYENSDFPQSSIENTIERFEASVHTRCLKMDGKFSSKEGSAVVEEKKRQIDTSSSNSLDSDDETNCHLEKDAVDSPNKLGENLRISNPTKGTGSLNCSSTNSSSNTSSSDEESDSVTNFYTTNKRTIDKTSFIGHPFGRIAKVGKTLSYSLQRQRENMVCDAPLPKQELKFKLNPIPCVDNRLKKSGETSLESSDEVKGIGGSSKLTFLPQSLKEVTSRQPKCSRNTNTLQSSDEKLSADKSSLSRTSSVCRPPRFLFSRSSVKKNVPRQLSELKKLNKKPKDSYESENSTGQPRASSVGSLGTMKPTTMGGTITNKRNFSSNSIVRMFSLTPPILNKHGHNSHTNKKTVSIQRLKASGSESIGYRESSLSQQEVLLAKDGSKKLSQLLTDDKLWMDTPS